MIKYIIDILKNEDNIFINDLGLFERKTVSAQMKDKTLLPPHNTILFDANGDGNGFAFILKYAEKNQKRLNDADTEIRKWVEELNAGIQNNKSVDIAEFGTFSLNSKGVIVFESAFIKELNLDFEGMEPVAVKPVKAKGKKEIEPVEESTPVPVIEEVETEEEATHEPQPEEVIVEEEPIVVVETPIVEEQSVVVVETPIVEEEEKEEPVVVVETPIVEEEEKEEPVVVVETPIMEEEEKEEIEEEEEEPSEEEEEKEEENEKKRGIQQQNIWVRITLFILILLLFPAIFFAYIHRVSLELTYKEYKHKFFHKTVDFPAQSDTQSSAFFAELTSRERASVKIVVPYVIDYNATETTPDVAGTVVETPPQPVEELQTQPFNTQDVPQLNFQEGKYYVIAGSFTEEKKAITHIKQHNLQKYNPTIVRQAGNNRVRVCVGVFDSEQKAEQFILSIQKDCWVLK